MITDLTLIRIRIGIRDRVRDISKKKNIFFVRSQGSGQRKVMYKSKVVTPGVMLSGGAFYMTTSRQTIFVLEEARCWPPYRSDDAEDE